MHSLDLIKLYVAIARLLLHVYQIKMCLCLCMRLCLRLCLCLCLCRCLCLLTYPLATLATLATLAAAWVFAQRRQHRVHVVIGSSDRRGFLLRFQLLFQQQPGSDHHNTIGD